MHFEFNNSSSVALQVVNLKTCLKQMKMDSDVPTNNNDMIVTLFLCVVNPLCQSDCLVSHSSNVSADSFDWLRLCIDI